MDNVVAEEQRAVSRSGSIERADASKKLGGPRKLRKAASKSSFAPVIEEESDRPPKTPNPLRRVPESWKTSSRSRASSSVSVSAASSGMLLPLAFIYLFMHTSSYISASDGA